MTASESAEPTGEQPVPSPAERLARIRDRFTDPKIIELRWALNGDDVRFLLEQIDAISGSPVVPSVGAVPVEVPEDDCWFGDDPNTVGAAAAANRVWCVQCADWIDQAVAHDTDHRRIAEGDLAGFAARVRAESEKQDEQIISERDEYHEWADRLAAALGGDAAGEHSSGNNPWQNALDIAGDRDARLRAEERQRLLRELAALAASDGEQGTVGWLNAVEDGDWLDAHRAAAGSAVPVATPTEPVTCRHCGHAVHGPVCLNMASDNDCPCRVDTRQPAEQDGQR